MRKLIIFFIAFTLYGCKSNYNEELSLFKTVDFNQVNSLDLFEIDTIKIDLSNTSLEGEWKILGNKIIFLDNNIPGIMEYDTLGNYIGKIIGSGRGPNEMITPSYNYLQLDSNKFVYIDYDSFFYIIDENLRKFNLFSELTKGVNKQKLTLTPDPSNAAIYEIDIMNRQGIYFNKNIILPITTEHILYNGYFKSADAKKFYLTSSTLISLQIDSTITFRIFGHFPNIYKNKIIPNYKECRIATDSNYLYVAYDADYKIYVYDKELNLVGSFGERQNRIKENFTQTKFLDDAEPNYYKHRGETGTYTNISFYNGLLLREFIYPIDKNSNEIISGIQIYKDHNLKAFLTRKYNNRLFNNFKVIGFIFPYYYILDKFNLEREECYILKAKIN